jgi:hypothetical protein
VNTKADIRFDVLGADFLPDWVKDNLMQQARRGRLSFVTATHVCCAPLTRPLRALLARRRRRTA